MNGRIIFRTPPRSGAFLKWAWEKRDGMDRNQRQGLAQAVYASLLAHIEATMVEILTGEYQRIINLISHAETIGNHPGEPGLSAFGTAMHVLMDKNRKVQNMTFSDLLKELELVPYPKFENGPKRHKPDLEAIQRLRNLFAYGRAASLPLSAETGDRIDTNGNAMKEALDRLIAKGIVSGSDSTASSCDMGSDEARLFDKLLSDAAVLHFVEVGRTFQVELCGIAPHSANLGFLDKFPNLADDTNSTT